MVPITLTINSVSNLRGLKGEQLIVFIRAEFGEKILGDSDQIECAASSPTVEFEFSSTLQCNRNDPNVLDEIAHKPILVTAIEVLPKDKKGKDEKTHPLAQYSIDLIPLLQGESRVDQLVDLHPIPGSPLDAAEAPKAEMEFSLHSPESLLTPERAADCNLLSFGVGSLYSTPDSWQANGPPFIYTASLGVPTDGEAERTLVFANGTLKTATAAAAAATEPTAALKRWSSCPNAQGGAAFIPGSVAPVTNYGEDRGDFRRREDQEFRTKAETTKSRVIWSTERRCHLEPSAVSSFEKKITASRYWPIEVFKTPIPTNVKGKKVEEEQPICFHGVAYVNLSPLLYPGATYVRGAYKVYPYNEEEVFQRKRPDEVDEEPEGVEPSEPNPEGQQYLDARSYIFVEVRLQRPIVPKREKEELAAKVAEYIPPRPLYPKRIGGAEQAVDDYHRQVASVANQLLDEFRGLFGDDIDSGDFRSDHEAMEERKRKFMYELTMTGKHFALKEQLKHSVIKIVREKFLRTKRFESPEEHHKFIADVYVFLIDQMHRGLASVMEVEDQAPLPQPVTDVTQIRHFAREAEINLEFELAEKYFTERISIDRQDPEHWLDYGKFCLLINDIGKAEECFRESIAVDPEFVPGLLLYGLICSNAEKYTEAEDFFEAAASIAPDDIVAHTMWGLYYMAAGNDILAGMAFEMADKINVDAARKAMESEAAAAAAAAAATCAAATSKTGDEESRAVIESSKSQRKPSIPQIEEERSGAKEVEEAERTPTPVPKNSPFLITANWLLDMRALSFAELALAQELRHPVGGLSSAYHIALGRLLLQKEDYKQAEAAIQDALQFSYQDSEAWALLGHIHFLQADYRSARDCYQRTLQFVNEPKDMHSIYLRLASIYLQEEQYQEAKETYLLAAKRAPSSVTWLGVGIACYRLGDLSQAEDALVEANILNNLDAAVWGYLSLVCLQTGRALEAEQSYKYCMKLDLYDQELLREIHQLQEEKGFGNPTL